MRMLNHLHLPASFYVDILTLRQVLDVDKPRRYDPESKTPLAARHIWREKMNVAFGLVVFKLRCGVNQQGSIVETWRRGLVERRTEENEFATWGTEELRGLGLDRRQEYVERFARKLVQPQDSKPKGYDVFEAALSSLVQPTNQPTAPAAHAPKSYPRAPLASGPHPYVRYLQEVHDPAADYHEPYATLLEVASDMIGVETKDVERCVRWVERRLAVEVGWMGEWDRRRIEEEGGNAVRSIDEQADGTMDVESVLCSI
ncbi:hypothetical protein HKX48_008292 [Thoreauomyces humboldtii]|nr:hypothetical protein HKX48_008292 [Thoreauomyces humboldtii]